MITSKTEVSIKNSDIKIKNEINNKEINETKEIKPVDRDINNKTEIKNNNNRKPISEQKKFQIDNKEIDIKNERSICGINKNENDNKFNLANIPYSNYMIKEKKKQIENENNSSKNNSKEDNGNEITKNNEKNIEKEQSMNKNKNEDSEIIKINKDKDLNKVYKSEIRYSNEIIYTKRCNLFGITFNQIGN